jgi:hypothetical protein
MLKNKRKNSYQKVGKFVLPCPHLARTIFVPNILKKDCEEV